ncbi:MAG: cupin domain-containing protein [Bacteroidales bacterium]|nr:cupin domain-containing protein [Bacteroidales bacterium]
MKKSIQYADDAIVSKIISKKETGNVTLFAFDKGQFLSEHTAPFDALVQIVEGTAQVSINSEEHTISEGEMIVMPANIPHAIVAESQIKMILIMIKS